jgi:hypothetical protein
VVDLAIMNGGAVDDITIDHCTFLGAVQGISNWGGNGWTISHNEIIDLKTGNGGGLGILIADYTGGVVQENVVSYNKISGTLYVGGWYEDPTDEHGGHNGSAVVIYADFRYGWAGASEITNNKVVHNKVSVESNNPSLVDVAAFELTDTRDDPCLNVIFDNAIGLIIFISNSHTGRRKGYG